MLGTRSIRRCQKLMNSRTLMTAVLLLSACASARQGRVSPGPGPTPQAKATGHRVPALFRQAPWAIETDADGNVVHIQEEAGVQFPLHAGELGREKARIYDEKRNDVGFFYGGAFTSSKAKCLYGLSVFVYPATEPLDRHLEAVRAELIRANPQASPTGRVLSLDTSHGGVGVHAGYLNEINNLESFEGVSIYERGGWFVKYRTTIGPAENLECEQRIRNAVAEMQLLRR